MSGVCMSQGMPGVRLVYVSGYVRCVSQGVSGVCLRVCLVYMSGCLVYSTSDARMSQGMFSVSRGLSGVCLAYDSGYR